MMQVVNKQQSSNEKLLSKIQISPAYSLTCGILPLKVACSSLVQFSKQEVPNSVTEEGIVMQVILEHFEKHPLFKEVTEEGIAMTVKLEQLLKQ